MSDQELRDKLANEYCAHDINRDRSSFRLGWDAARAHSPEQAELTAQNLQMASLLERAVVAAEALLEERNELQRQLDLLNKDLDSTTECLVAEQKMREDAMTQLQWSLRNEEQYKQELAASMKRENELRAELSRQENLALDEFSRWETMQKERDQLRAAAEKLAESLEYHSNWGNEAGTKKTNEALAEYRAQFLKEAK